MRLAAHPLAMKVSRRPRVTKAKIANGAVTTDEIAAAYKFRQPVYVAELDFAALLTAPPAPMRYTPLPRFPSVVRDISLLVAARVLPQP